MCLHHYTVIHYWVCILFSEVHQISLSLSLSLRLFFFFFFFPLTIQNLKYLPVTKDPSQDDLLQSPVTAKYFYSEREIIPKEAEKEMVLF